MRILLSVSQIEGNVENLGIQMIDTILLTNNNNGVLCDTVNIIRSQTRTTTNHLQDNTI